MAKSQREIELEIKSLELQKEANKADIEALKRLDKKIIAQEKLLSKRKLEADLVSQNLSFEKQLLKDLKDERFKSIQLAGLDIKKTRKQLLVTEEILNAKKVNTEEELEALRVIGKIKNLEEGIRKSVIEQSDEVKTLSDLQGEFKDNVLDTVEAFIKASNIVDDFSLENLLGDLADFSKKSKKDFMDLSELGKGFADEITDLFKVGGLLGFGAILAQQFIEFGKNIQANRRELGLTVAEATRLSGQSQILGIRAKEFGMGVEDVRKIQASILENLGGQAKLTNELVNDFLVLEGTLGVTADTASKLLPIFDAVGAAGERGAVAQIESLGALIRLEGLSPGQILGDVASNTEFFAKFAKDGGNNLIRAAISAKKLGLELSSVNQITESLLDFETSIEKQLEASLLLGRQINLDRARQLALTGDVDGLLEEVRRQIGTEAEFNRLLVPQREALAQAFGLSVEDVARAVRGTTAAVSGGAASGDDDFARQQIALLGDSNRLLGKIAGNTE